MNDEKIKETSNSRFDIFKTSKNNTIIISSLVLFIAVTLIFILKRPYEKPSQIPQASTPIIDAQAHVDITKDGFIPETLTVNKNTLVIFTNTDESDHFVSADPYPTGDSYPEFNSKGNIKPGTTFMFLFDTPGAYNYHDKLNPMDLQGTIVVQE